MSLRVKLAGSHAKFDAAFTFSIIAEAHLGLPKTNGVFSLADSIELFKLGLVHTLDGGQRLVYCLDFNFCLNHRPMVMV